MSSMVNWKHITRTLVGIASRAWLPILRLGKKKRTAKLFSNFFLPNLGYGRHSPVAIPTWVLGICEPEPSHYLSALAGFRLIS